MTLFRNMFSNHNVALFRVKIYLRCIAGVFVLLMSMNIARAVTVTGADIRVDYIGTAGPTDLTYRVFVTIYTQCDASGSIALKPNIEIDVSSTKHGINMKIPLARMLLTGQDTLSPLCPSGTIRNSCFDINNVSQWPGYIRNTYTTVISLPIQSDDWVFYYWHPGNGRGFTSQNLCDAMVMHVAAVCEFNNLDRYDNSSPRFTANPFTYLRVGVPQQIYNGAADPDLDSIVVTPYYSLGCLVFNGANCPSCGGYSEVTYAAGFTVNNPIPTFMPNTYHVDPQTGTASFTTLGGGNFAFGFKLEEYDRRTGKLLGFVLRDIALPVLNYTGGDFRIDSLPANVNGAVVIPAGTNNLVVCPGTPLTFDIGLQPGAVGSITMDAGYATAPGANFTVTGNGTASPVGSFSWTPGVNDVGVHEIHITATESACSNPQYPMDHKKKTVVIVKVIPGIEAGPDQNYCVLDEDTVILDAGRLPGVSWQWTNFDGTPASSLEEPDRFATRAMPSATTTYVVTATGLPASCKSRDTVTVHVDTLNYLTVTPPSPIVLCEDEFMELDVTASGPPPFQNFPCDLTGDMPATAEVAADIVPLRGVVQAGGNAQSTPFGDLITARHQYLIRKSDMQAAGMRSGMLTGMTLFAAGNTAGVSYGNLKIHLKCTPLTALDPTSFEPGTIPVYAGSGMVSIPASGRIDFDFDAWYNWDSTQNLIVEICYTNKTGVTGIQTEFYPSIYTSCVYTMNAAGNSVCGGGVSSAGPDAVNELPRIEFRYHPAPEADFAYAWLRMEGDYLSDTAGKNPSIDITQRTKYYVHSRGRSGCLLRDSLDVFISDRSFAIRPADTTICAGDTAFLYVTGGYYHQWYEGDYQHAGSLSCADCASPVAIPQETADYTVIVRDSFRCADTLHARITVLPASSVRILTEDTLIRYGQRVQLEATGAEFYSWEPPLYLDNPGIANPVASPTEDIVYTITGASHVLCSSKDSVRIRIDYRDHIMVPSAFSPNGDGKNDVFKVVNMTFQQLVEFRVFNRWGEEVYAAAGGKAAWDGTWNGEQQEVGTYHYIIRVAYPDGYYETYQGDVTLVR